MRAALIFKKLSKQQQCASLGFVLFCSAVVLHKLLSFYDTNQKEWNVEQDQLALSSFFQTISIEIIQTGLKYFSMMAIATAHRENTLSLLAATLFSALESTAASVVPVIETQPGFLNYTGNFTKKNVLNPNTLRSNFGVQAVYIDQRDTNIFMICKYKSSCWDEADPGFIRLNISQNNELKNPFNLAATAYHLTNNCGIDLFSIKNNRAVYVNYADNGCSRYLENNAIEEPRCSISGIRHSGSSYKKLVTPEDMSLAVFYYQYDTNYGIDIRGIDTQNGLKDILGQFTIGVDLTDMFFCAGNTLLCVATAQTILVLDISNPAAITILRNITTLNNIENMAWSSDQQSILVNYNNATLDNITNQNGFSILNKTTFEEMARIITPYKIVGDGIITTPDNRYAFIAYDSSTLYRYEAGFVVMNIANLARPVEVAKVSNIGTVATFAFNHASSIMYVATDLGLFAYRINMNTTRLTPVPLTSQPATFAPETNVPVTPQTAQPSIQTPAPTPDATDPFNVSPEPAAPPIPNNRTLAPGETEAPEPNIQVVTNSTDYKIQFNTINVDSLTVQIRVRPYRLGIGEFMTALLPSLGATFDKNTGTLIITDRTPLEINTALVNLRFSLNDPAYNQSSVVIIASTDGGVTFPFRGEGNLNQFGSNDAPVIVNNTAALINKTFAYGATFGIFVKNAFNDTDGDPLKYSQQDNCALNGVMNNGVWTGPCITQGVTNCNFTATDSYKKSLPVEFSVNCQYFPPAIIQGLLPDKLIYKAGQRPDAPFSIDGAFTGTGQLTYSASWDGLSILPNGFSFNATDSTGAFISKTIEVDVTDKSPVASNITLQSIIAPVEKTKLTMIPVNIITDPDDPQSSMIYSLNPVYNWMQLVLSQINIHFLSLTITPPQNFLGQILLFSLCGFDGYFSACRNLTLIVPPNAPPYANVNLPNITKETGDDLVYRILSDAFLSPGNYSLTYNANELDAEGRAIGLSNSFKFDKDTLFGKLTSDDVGIHRIIFIATDSLGSSANQIVYITVTLSTLERIKYYFEFYGTRVGIPVTVLGMIYGAYQYYEMRSVVLNTLTGCGYILKRPKFIKTKEDDLDRKAIIVNKEGAELDCQIKRRQTIFTLQIECLKNLTLYPEYLQRVAIQELDFLNRIVARLVEPFSYYWFGRQTLMPVETPDWIRFNDVTYQLVVYRDAILEKKRAKKVTVQLRAASGRIYHELNINPRNFFSNTSKRHKNEHENELEEELLTKDALEEEEEEEEEEEQQQNVPSAR